MKAALWFLLLLILPSCSPLADGDGKSRDTREVIGHRAGLLVRAGDLLGTTPFSFASEDEDARDAPTSARGPKVVASADASACVAGTPCCAAADVTGPESKNPAERGETFPRRRRGPPR